MSTVIVTKNQQKTNPPKAFGGLQTISKGEHEKERQRWTQKMDELEMRLMEAESSKSEMNQTKAELNKKIVEMNRNQRPVIERNRKLKDRNRLLQLEIRKMEDKVRNVLDDYLTIKDAFERLTKENEILKEKRQFPEKMDEFERYRNQVLEYSKFINALRQAGLEKDRRYDLLAQKFKRLRKCLSSSRGIDEDRQSLVGGSDCSASSISLDTITEDIDQVINMIRANDLASTFCNCQKDTENNFCQLSNEHQELQMAYSTLEMDSMEFHTWSQKENELRNQLGMADRRILELENTIRSEFRQQEKTDIFESQREQIDNLQNLNDRLERELVDSKEHNELLQFQVLEIQETSKQEFLQSDFVENATETCDQAVETENCQEFCSNFIDDDDRNDLLLEDLKIRLTLLKHRVILKKEDRMVIRQLKDYIDSLENQLRQWEIHQVEWIDKIRELENRQVEMIKSSEEEQSKQRKKQELQAEIDFLHKKIAEIESIHTKMNESRENELRKLKMSEIDEQMRVAQLSQQLADINEIRKCEIETMEENAKKQTELKECLRLAELEKRKAETALKMSKFGKENFEEMANKYEGSQFKLKEALKVISDYESVIITTKQRCVYLEQQQELLRNELNKTKEYNEQLGKQFTLQMTVINALKRKVKHNQAGGSSNVDEEWEEINQDIN